MTKESDRGQEKEVLAENWQEVLKGLKDKQDKLMSRSDAADKGADRGAGEEKIVKKKEVGDFYKNLMKNQLGGGKTEKTAEAVSGCDPTRERLTERRRRKEPATTSCATC